MWGHLQAVELLVNGDADIEIRDNDGGNQTALMLSRAGLVRVQISGQTHSVTLSKLCRG